MFRLAVVLLALAGPAYADQSLLHRWLYGADKTPTEAAAGSTEVAFSACAMLDATGLTASPCEVGVGQVIATIDMTGAEAREACPQMAAILGAKGLTFDPGWTLAIRSPYSGGNSIAFCNLPT